MRSDDDALADTIFDGSNRLSGSGDDPIGPRLELLITQVSRPCGLCRRKELRLKLRGFFLEFNPHVSQGAAKGTNSSVKM